MLHVSGTGVNCCRPMAFSGCWGTGPQGPQALRKRQTCKRGVVGGRCESGTGVSSFPVEWWTARMPTQRRTHQHSSGVHDRAAGQSIPTNNNIPRLLLSCRFPTKYGQSVPYLHLAVPTNTTGRHPIPTFRLVVGSWLLACILHQCLILRIPISPPLRVAALGTLQSTHPPHCWSTSKLDPPLRQAQAAPRRWLRDRLVSSRHCPLSRAREPRRSDSWT